MKYKELQTLLKAFKQSGHKLNCNLNQKAAVLQAEYNRITALTNAKHGVKRIELSMDTINNLFK